MRLSSSLNQQELVAQLIVWLSEENTVNSVLIMKQEIVIEVPLKCEKCRSKVMTIASEAIGVTTVKFERKERDRVIIIGEGVDATLLTKSLRKKLSYAHLVAISKLEDS